jgi:predicted CXXCH cytochrome family protein
MSFLLRRIAITADGREIIRATPVADSSIIVGRDAASALHLADLAVNPQHARITTNDGRHIEVESLTSLGFEVDGRTVDRVTIDAGDGAELRFGGHRITVGLDTDSPSPRISLTIARTDELSHSALDRDEATAFSLRGKIPGRRMSAWLFSIFVLAAFLAAPIYAWMSWRGVEERPNGFHADASWTSGPLSTAHASLADDCQSCHVDAFVAVTDNSCLSCHDDDAHDHAPLTRQLAAKGDPGAWRATLIRIGAAFNRPEGRCVDCHTEHEGAGPMPATAQQFCTDCHDGMSARLTDTKLGDAGDFGTSHPQFRPLVMTSPGATADDEPVYRRMTWTAALTENNGLKFPHGLHLQRAGGVARMARSLDMQTQDGAAGLDCASCHKPTADRVRFQPVDMERDCQSCHSLAFESVGGVTRTLRHGQPQQVIADLYAYYRSTPPTRPINLGGMARRRPGGFAEGETYNIYFRETAVRPSRADDAVRAVFSRGGACNDCHTITPPRGGNSWQVTPVAQTTRYMEHGWFDHDDHNDDGEQCSDCHAAARSTNANQLLIPGIKTCRDCHGGEGSDADVASSCASCHEYHAGEDATQPWRPTDDRRDREGRGRVIAVTDGGTRRLYGGL